MEVSPTWLPIIFGCQMNGLAFYKAKPETGMGYQIVTFVLADGRRFDRVPVVQSALVGDIPGFWKTPFGNEDIIDIIVTHDKREQT